MSSKIQFQVSLSFMQIYMENISDLLDDSKDKVLCPLMNTKSNQGIGSIANTRGP